MAEQSGVFEDEWNASSFEKYLNTTNMDSSNKELLLQRFEMHSTVGNNNDYLGNGLTKNNNTKVTQEYGVVETLNFERREINLDQLNQANAIKVIPGLKPL